MRPPACINSSTMLGEKWRVSWARWRSATASCDWNCLRSEMSRSTAVNRRPPATRTSVIESSTVVWVPGARVAEGAGGGVVELDDAAGLVDGDDGIERGIEDGAHAGLAGAQVGLHVLAVSDVAQRADQPGGGAMLVDDEA